MSSLLNLMFLSTNKGGRDQFRHRLVAPDSKMALDAVIMAAQPTVRLLTDWSNRLANIDNKLKRQFACAER